MPIHHIVLVVGGDEIEVAALKVATLSKREHEVLQGLKQG
jgi:hypothetical protein